MKTFQIARIILALLLGFVVGVAVENNNSNKPFKVTFEKSSDSEFELSKLHLQKDSTDTKVWFVNGVRCTPTINYYTFTINPKNYK